MKNKRHDTIEKLKGEKLGERQQKEYDKFVNASKERFLKKEKKKKLIEGKKNLSVLDKYNEEKNKRKKSKHKKNEVNVVIESYGEQVIDNILSKLKVNYVREKEFSEMVSEKGFPLRLDFYIPEFNIAIEYDGEQHYNSEMHLTNEKYLYYLDCDTRKTEYCLSRGINLVRFTKQDLNKMSRKIKSLLINKN
jgi:very-short-patch-repair endonuclease